MMRQMRKHSTLPSLSSATVQMTATESRITTEFLKKPILLEIVVE